MEPEKTENPSNLIRGWLWFRGIPSRLQSKLYEVARQAKTMAKEDPRRLIHSLKVGLAVTLVLLPSYHTKPVNSRCNKRAAMEPEKTENPSNLIRGWLWFRGIPSRLQSKLYEVARQAKTMAKEDPRRLIHSLKVGLAVTLVSLLYYFQPMYNNFGVSTMWAVMTVVVVFEFSVGATIGKGLNRGLATLAAAALGLGAHHLASLTGKSNEPYLIGGFVFIQVVATTFIRFFPKLKVRYDYGMLVFILTFCLVSISGFRSNEVLKLVQTRIITILIGACTCLAVSILICPVWAGEDLHKFVAQNIGQLGNLLEGHKASYDARTEMKRHSTININSILVDSKSREESLANLAGWEPGHGQFTYCHPWKQYLKIGKLTRQCACRLEPLNGYSHSKFHAPPEIQRAIQEGFSEYEKALKEVAWAVETMAKPSSPNPHIANLKISTLKLKSLLESSDGDDALQIIPVAAVMIDAVSCVEQMADAVNELAELKSSSRNGAEGESESGKNSEPCMQTGTGEILTLCIAVDGAESSAGAADQI